MTPLAAGLFASPMTLAIATVLVFGTGTIRWLLLGRVRPKVGG